MNRYFLFVLIAFSLPSILFSPAAVAQCTSPITVSSYADSGAGTLRDALARICSPGEIDIPAPGTNGIPPGATITLSTAGDYTFGPSALAIPVAHALLD